MHSGEKSNMDISAPTNKVPALAASWTSLTPFYPTHIFFFTWTSRPENTWENSGDMKTN